MKILTALVLVATGCAASPPASDPVVSGRLLWPDGMPLTGAVDEVHLTAFSVELRRVGHEEFEVPVGRLFPLDGRFRFEGLTRDEYELVVFHEIHSHRSNFVHLEELGTFTVRPGDRDLVLRVPTAPDRTLVDVRIEDDRGRPVRSGVVIVDLARDEPWGFSPEFVVTPGLTRCLLRSVETRVALTVYDAIDADGNPLGRVSTGPLPVSPSPIRLRLPPGRSLRGRVLGPDGTGLPGIPVTAAHAGESMDTLGGWEPGSINYWRRTDGEGRFTIPGLRAAPARLLVRPGAPWVHPEEREVPPGEDDLTLRLKRGVMPTIRILDPEGEAVSRGYLVVGVEGGKEIACLLVRRGRARPWVFDPDRKYALAFFLEGWEPGSPAALTIDDWTPADTTLRRR
jgi:hypothetical protein